MLQNKLQLRPYQQDAVNVFTFGGLNNGIIVCPTGAGKSIIIAELVNSFTDSNILVLQPSKEILQQNYDKYCLYASDASIYSASLNSKQINRVTFATIGSIIKLPDKTLKLFDIIIIDECHLVSLEGQYYDLISIIEPQKLIGLTATPYRNNFKYSVTYEMLTRKRNPIFKTIGYKYEIADCIKDGFWSELKYFMPIQYDTSKLQVKGSEYSDISIQNYNIEIELHKNIISIVNGSYKKHFLVFLTTIQECIITAELLTEAGISCVAIHSKLHKKEREQILIDFKCGKVKVILNVGILTTGFDFPELDCVILARPTMSLSLYYQMLGRIVRIHKDKSCAEIYDLCGNVKSFGKIETLRFIGNDYSRLGMVSDTKILIKPPKSYYDTIQIKNTSNIGSVVLEKGKYEGKTVQEVYDSDKNYIQFCIDKETSFATLFRRFLKEQEELIKKFR